VIPEEEARLHCIKKILGFLSKGNFVLLKTLFSFLKKVCDFSEKNKMSPKNVAVCFAPNILKTPNKSTDLNEMLQQSGMSNDLTESLITHYPLFFLNLENTPKLPPRRKTITKDSTLKLPTESSPKVLQIESPPIDSPTEKLTEEKKEKFLEIVDFYDEENRKLNKIEADLMERKEKLDKFELELNEREKKLKKKEEQIKKKEDLLKKSPTEHVPTTDKPTLKQLTVPNKVSTLQPTKPTLKIIQSPEDATRGASKSFEIETQKNDDSTINKPNRSLSIQERMKLLEKNTLESPTKKSKEDSIDQRKSVMNLKNNSIVKEGTKTWTNKK
jgi:hypothetical protein